MNKRRYLRLAVISLLAGPAFAQDATVPVPLGLERGLPVSPGDEPAPNVARESVELSAVVTTGADAIEEGLSWHVFERSGNEARKLVAVREGGSQTLRLPVGEYVVHVAYGRAAAVSPLTLRTAGAKLDPIVLNAGGMSLAAEAGGTPIDGEAVRFAIYEVDGEQRRLVQPDVAAGETVRLVRGVYRVVAQYGETNAVAAADIRVRSGEVTEATLGVPGAPVTLKLVRPNADAPVAATSWRIFDAEGEQVFESDEPAPGTILAAGTYTAEAVNRGSPVTKDFTVRPGVAADVAVTLPGT